MWTPAKKINGGVPGAVLGAAYMVGRAVTAAMKGHIELKAETEKIRKLYSNAGDKLMYKDSKSYSVEKKFCCNLRQKISL